MVLALTDTVQVALVTGITGVLSGLLGYGAARGQRALEEKRLEYDRDTRAAETAKARYDALEALYLDYLASLDEIRRIARSDEALPADVDRWWQEMKAVDNRLQLSGSKDVREAATAMGVVLQSFYEAMEWYGDDFAASAHSSWHSARDKILAARGTVMEAMRADLSDRSNLIRRS